MFNIFIGAPRTLLYALPSLSIFKRLAKQLKSNKTGRVFLVATFGLFTKGYEIFDEAYSKGVFDKLYVTNLNYVPEEIKNKPWFEEVDCSMKLANIICNINEDKPIGNLLNAKEETVEKIKKLRNR